MRTALLAALLLVGCAAPDHDLLVLGGTIVDGSGAPPRVADLAIDGERIVAIGELGDRTARDVIDASGLVVAPGFIDLHSHADLILLAVAPRRDALLEAKIRQGVTTVIVGNCGLGTAPADTESAEILAGINAWMTPEGVGMHVGDVADYLETLERSRPPLNVGTLVPHGPLSLHPEGSLAEALDAGAFGLSVGLIYPPGMLTPTDELVELARTVAAHDALFTAHVRGSSELLLDATAELLSIAERSGARVHHSHLEAVGEDYWPRIDEVLALEDAARAGGASVTHDVFLYDRAATMMIAIFPPWALDGGVPGLLDRLRDPEARERIRRDIEQRPSDDRWPHNLVRAVGWDGILLASVPDDGPTDWVGHSLRALAREKGTDPFSLVVDLMSAHDGRVGQLVAEISGDAGLEAILTHPAAIVISDAEDYGRGVPHPAHAGAFARALRWNRERGLESLQRMVHRMTGAPADLLGLTERGRIAEGAIADLVLFDAATVSDRADWERPRAFAEGIPWVVVGGRPVVADGRYEPAGSGGVLRSRPSPSGASTSLSAMRSAARPSP